MTAVLSPITLSPFHDHIQHGRYNVSCSSLVSLQSQSTSPASLVLSHSFQSSASLGTSSNLYHGSIRNAENVTSSTQIRHDLSDPSTYRNGQQINGHRDPGEASSPSGTESINIFRHWNEQILPTTTISSHPSETNTKVRKDLHFFRRRPVRRMGQNKTTDDKADFNEQPGAISGNAIDEALEPFPNLAVEPSSYDSMKILTPVATRNRRHRYRVSDASSAFVRTIKTASISNGSFSLFQRSSRMGQSSDDQSVAYSSRKSIDSERPVTATSFDDVAYARAIRRHQILEEIMSTEESYVADLKALLYLYSTLLATNSAISNTTRAAMQRNVSTLLHLHERILDGLQRAAYRGAARRWADTALPISTRPNHHIRWRSVGPHPRTRHGRRQSRCKTSVDHTETPCLRSRAGTADAADVLDLTAIFEIILPALFVYEEYCANYEIITSELQKQTLELCTTYEAGMESLAKVLTTIEEKVHQGRKGLTVGDLLIKPVQRICRYPLLLNDLLRQTPSVDGPGAHEALENVLQRLRSLVEEVNAVMDDSQMRMHIQQRVTLQNKLDLETVGVSANDFRSLGRVQLCGVLYITYRTVNLVRGAYALCVLFGGHFLIALPKPRLGTFEMFALIELNDLATGAPDNGSGLQCSSTLFTFKLCFVAQDNVHEIMLSACSALEERQWLSGLGGDLKPSDMDDMLISTTSTRTFLDLRPIRKAFYSEVPLARQSSIQRAATIASKSAICQVILRNTHNPHDLNEYRNLSGTNVGRSISHATSVKTIVMAPKRSDRVKLESTLSEIWTKERLPYPRMIASKSSQILRASAGSLVRKLSLASIQAPFSRRSASTTVSSKKSYDALTEARKEPPRFRIRRQSLDDSTPIRSKRPQEVPELDTMDNVIGRMIGGGSYGSKRLSFTGLEKSAPKVGTVRRRLSSRPVGLDDPAAILYDDDHGDVEASSNEPSDPHKEYDKSAGWHHKTRWSNPMLKLKELGSEGLKSILHHSK